MVFANINNWVILLSVKNILCRTSLITSMLALTVSITYINHDIVPELTEGTKEHCSRTIEPIKEVLVPEHLEFARSALFQGGSPEVPSHSNIEVEVHKAHHHHAIIIDFCSDHYRGLLYRDGIITKWYSISNISSE